MTLQKSEPTVVSATQAQRKFGEIVRQVLQDSVHFIVERKGRPVMAIIPIPEYRELIRARERREKEREAARQVENESKR